MKKLMIYVIADIVSETILSVFSAISPEMADRMFCKALEANKDKIYDKESIRLFSASFDKSSSCPVQDFVYSVPESYDEVVNNFDDITDISSFQEVE